jgi:hyperosmotically inducible periplasmic protein
MRSAMRRICVLGVMIILIAGCQSMKSETLGENIDDASITTAVKTKLAEDRPATLTQISVETSLRTVHLTGAVKDEFLRQRAAELAKSVKGVREVVNDITVQANP